jgi:hypothetical protein
MAVLEFAAAVSSVGNATSTAGSDDGIWASELSDPTFYSRAFSQSTIWAVAAGDSDPRQNLPPQIWVPSMRRPPTRPKALEAASVWLGLYSLGTDELLTLANVVGDWYSVAAESSEGESPEDVASVNLTFWGLVHEGQHALLTADLSGEKHAWFNAWQAWILPVRSAGVSAAILLAAINWRLSVISVTPAASTTSVEHMKGPQLRRLADVLMPHGPPSGGFSDPLITEVLKG